MDIARTLESAYRTVEHAESIIWHALDDDTDPEGMARLAEQIARSGVAVTPTLIVHANLAKIVEIGWPHVERPDMAGFNPVVLNIQRGEYDYWANRQDSDRPAMQAAYEAFTGMLHEAGVPLLMGSDDGVMATPHGVSALEELERLVRAGLTPEAALPTATLNAAEFVTPDAHTGRIAPGYAADLVLVDADPRGDFQILRRPDGVMVGGFWCDQAALTALRETSRRPGVWRSRWRLLVHFLSR